MEKKIAIRGQIILAVIPIFITQLIAFYRIKKLKSGGLRMLVLFLGLVVIDYFILSALFDKESDMYVAGNILQIIVILPPSVYWIRKWTLEFNEKIESQP